MRDASPLRYPGGKWRLTDYFVRFIRLNFRSVPNYAEPYAGGGSLALSLLFLNQVNQVFINDLDPAIYSFWKAITTETARFIDSVRRTVLTPTEWKRQKDIFKKRFGSECFEMGFATFYLNRTNHSGILNGGMIGGKEQKGKWKLDARFNRKDLIRRIERVASYANRIHLYRLDALDFLNFDFGSGSKLYYLDPPYYRSGYSLYLNSYTPDDHVAVRNAVKEMCDPWLLSYDDIKETRTLYKGFRSRRIQLLHTARSSKLGYEVVFFSPTVRIPKTIKCGNKPINGRG